MRIWAKSVYRREKYSLSLADKSIMELLQVGSKKSLLFLNYPITAVTLISCIPKGNKSTNWQYWWLGKGKWLTLYLHFFLRKVLQNVAQFLPINAKIIKSRHNTTDVLLISKWSEISPKWLENIKSYILTIYRWISCTEYASFFFMLEKQY